MLPFKLFFHPGFTVDLGPHVFPAQKYRLVRDRLLETGLADHGDLVAPLPADDGDVLRVHSAEYVRKVRTGAFSVVEARTLEVPWSESLVKGIWLATGAAIEAGRRALTERCAVVIGGGFHHAFPDHGEGFCLVNDVAVAVRALQARGDVARVGVIDLDVHHGNGVAAILGGDARCCVCSIHQEHNYPADKPASHVDVGLPDGTGDAAYLAAMDAVLDAMQRFSPDLCFYLAGADPYENDRLGGLCLTMDGLRQRDRRVFTMLRERGIPVVVLLAGGYAERPADTVTIHANTIAEAAAVYGPVR